MEQAHDSRCNKNSEWLVIVGTFTTLTQYLAWRLIDPRITPSLFSSLPSPCRFAHRTHGSRPCCCVHLYSSNYRPYRERAAESFKLSRP